MQHKDVLRKPSFWKVLIISHLPTILNRMYSLRSLDPICPDLFAESTFCDRSRAIDVLIHNIEPSLVTACTKQKGGPDLSRTPTTLRFPYAAPFKYSDIVEVRSTKKEMATFVST